MIGNVPTGMSAHLYTYDYRNQMVSFTNPDGKKYAYIYDVFGRRVGKIVDEGTPSAVGSYYFYLGDRMVEEKNDAGTKMASYLYGQYIDDALAVVRNINGTQTGYVYETDDQYNVLAVTDNAGNVVERYDYDAFGKPTIYAPDFTVRQTSAIGRKMRPSTRWKVKIGMSATTRISPVSSPATRRKLIFCRPPIVGITLP